MGLPDHYTMVVMIDSNQGKCGPFTWKLNSDYFK